ncbi:MAG: hypothetical protein CME65_02320 [Halobacteriovoraceae bacterium]|nr:hypothetical protein [Halobacteriovoraceae bacterium]|tara:strand:+ start:6001 stop:6591 length:591 start_codon:yes stop_codon:yes gene_type:complete
MTTGEKTDKNPKIGKFINDVITDSINAVQRDSSNLPTGTLPSPVVSKNSLGVAPNQFSSIGTNSTVPTRGGQLTASALSDLFFVYAHNLTSIRRATVTRLSTNDGTPSSSTLWSNQITSLSSDYKMATGTFRTQVNAQGDPLSGLQPGSIASNTAIDTLIAALQTVLQNNRTSASVSITVCHSSCHSSCHGSRGRR